MLADSSLPWRRGTAETFIIFEGGIQCHAEKRVRLAVAQETRCAVSAADRIAAGEIVAGRAAAAPQRGAARRVGRAAELAPDPPRPAAAARAAAALAAGGGPLPASKDSAETGSAQARCMEAPNVKPAAARAFFVVRASQP